MIWGVGTGRCGTKSLARDLGGLHEPKPWLKDQPVRWHLFKQPRLERELKGLLLDRKNLSVPAVVDLKHSYVIPLIRETDPRPEFYWMIRNPVSCIRSHLAGGGWTKTDYHGERKLYPRYGWGERTRLDKAIYFWVGTNAIIYSEFEKREEPWVIQTPDQLKNHVNHHSNSKSLVFTEEELKKIKEYCFPLWERISDNLGEYV